MKGAKTRLDAKYDSMPIVMDTITNAETAKIYFEMIDKIGGCSVVSIKTDADVWYKGDPNKIAYRNFFGYFHFILFDNYN